MHYHEHYDHYHPEMVQRLDGFYGDVETSIHKNILKNISGKKVLDIGCGFGSLVNFLQNQDPSLEVLGIDQHEPSVTAGQQRFPKANIHLSSGPLDEMPEQSFDTIIMKDVIHHVYDEDDINLFLTQIKRLCRKRLIIVDPNPTFILKLSRQIIKHDDPICSPKQAIHALEDNGFKFKKIFYSEFLSFPLSGGFVGPEIVKSTLFRKIFLNLDLILNHIMRFLKLDRLLCWRYYIVADVD